MRQSLYLFTIAGCSSIASGLYIQKTEEDGEMHLFKRMQSNLGNNDLANLFAPSTTTGQQQGGVAPGGGLSSALSQLDLTALENPSLQAGNSASQVQANQNVQNQASPEQISQSAQVPEGTSNEETQVTLEQTDSNIPGQSGQAVTGIPITSNDQTITNPSNPSSPAGDLDSPDIIQGRPRSKPVDPAFRSLYLQGALGRSDVAQGTNINPEGQNSGIQSPESRSAGAQSSGTDGSGSLGSNSQQRALNSSGRGRLNSIVTDIDAPDPDDTGDDTSILSPDPQIGEDLRTFGRDRNALLDLARNPNEYSAFRQVSAQPRREIPIHAPVPLRNIQPMVEQNYIDNIPQQKPAENLSANRANTGSRRQNDRNTNAVQPLRPPILLDLESMYEPPIDPNVAGYIGGRESRRGIPGKALGLLGSAWRAIKGKPRIENPMGQIGQGSTTGVPNPNSQSGAIQSGNLGQSGLPQPGAPIGGIQDIRLVQSEIFPNAGQGSNQVPQSTVTNTVSQGIPAQNNVQEPSGQIALIESQGQPTTGELDRYTYIPGLQSGGNRPVSGVSESPFMLNTQNPGYGNIYQPRNNLLGSLESDFPSNSVSTQTEGEGEESQDVNSAVVSS
ncbi:hypothetical protein ABW19_dt0209867 [Dactylella cylindrospora]|nr:hypothetical protein ABW19_dt0209867 [Dactylella cylindrospora]